MTSSDRVRDNPHNPAKKINRARPEGRRAKKAGIVPALRDQKLADLHIQKVDDNPPVCAFCGKVIPKPRRYKPNVKYCTSAEGDRYRRRKYTEQAQLRELQKGGNPDRVLYPKEKIRQGDAYERIALNLTPTEWDDWVDRKITDNEVSGLAGVNATPAAVGMARRAAWNNRILKAQRKRHRPSQNFMAMLGPSDAVMLKLLEDDPVAFEKKLDDLVEAFVTWRTHFFTVGRGRGYITKPVHKRWIRATLKTIYTGGRQLILSPPRHGKTELLIHFCVWAICRNPDIRILWIGPNSDIAENCLGQVRDLLETHDALKAAYLAPGQTWHPARRGQGLWQRTKFTVDNRTQPLKQPTMWCTGTLGKILSIDADFIIVDDPADPDTSYTPSGRAKIENWFKVKLITRKMMHTGLTMISSRVHPEDLYSLFVDSPSWEVVVDRAHDQAICGLGLYEDHTALARPQACVLFPEINPLGYLREQHDVVGEALFEMMYLNQPRPDGSLIFDPDVIRAECFDFSRGLGVSDLGTDYKLVAGLDPAARGIQAAFLWAVVLPDPEKVTDPRYQVEERYYMIDLEAQQAGGIEGAIRVMRDWHEKYDCELWVIEDNSYQKVFFDDPRVKALAQELDLEIRPTHTGANKHDPDFGVAAMAPVFHEGKVVLPYSATDPEARRKVDSYVKELVNFTGDTNSARTRKSKSDILMASWFPFAKVIKKWKREIRQHTVRTTTPISYPAMGSSESPDMPWVGTEYVF